MQMKFMDGKPVDPGYAKTIAALVGAAAKATEVCSEDEFEDQSNKAERIKTHAVLLSEMKADGLTIGECIKAFAVGNDDPYVRSARADVVGTADMEIDDATVISPGDGGAFVLAWIWISDEAAGILKNADVLEGVLDHAKKAMKSKKDFNSAEQIDQIYADWLEDLIGNFADELDSIETEVPGTEPGPIVWQDQEMNCFEFMPSTALLRLLTLARTAGLPTNNSQQAETFCLQYGNKLDAILTVLQTA